MTVVELRSGALHARLSTKGGTILGFETAAADGRTVPLLRAAPGDDADALHSACYPLVPFANRVRDNRFRFDGTTYTLEPNTDWDRHRLHGEGWTSDWRIVSADGCRAEMAFHHDSDAGTPYRYSATQTFTLSADGLQLTLAVTNEGDRPLPFGLGWHPYFPLTPQTTLEARSRFYWTEVDAWLPGERAAIPKDLDFARPRKLPRRWVNNGFEGWGGTARIVWPERSVMVEMTADPLFRHAFLFVGDKDFDPDYADDYFCFEPMSHLADGHNMAGLGDLVVLAPGERLSGSIVLRPQVQEGEI